MAVPQFLDAIENGEILDYIVFDYLAEITMSILARQRSLDPAQGYASDFVHNVLKPHLTRIAKSGVKIISNAGGVNPVSCGAAVRALVKAAGLDLKVAVISGDDILSEVERYAGAQDMFSQAPFPALDTVASANVYLGAFPIAKALGAGADIIITGRVVDSAVTLGACIHEFGWGGEDFDLLASGSLAGHIIECGPQVTGGNFTDWEDVPNIANIGYPIASISEDGRFDVSKPKSTGGLVSVGTVAEQMLYEIDDPTSYMLPDVTCDFSQVTITQSGPDVVSVSPAKGRSAPVKYKACLTYHDGWKIVSLWMFVGEKARAKGLAYGNAALTRALRKLSENGLPRYTEASVTFFGDDSHYGKFVENKSSREVVMKLAAKHKDKNACALLFKEATGLALATPAGLAPLSAARPKPTPVIRLLSFLVPKSYIKISIDIDGEVTWFSDRLSTYGPSWAERIEPAPIDMIERLIEVPLSELAFARSGDKGNKANIGVMPRRAEYAPYIWDALSDDALYSRFEHFKTDFVERFYLPGTASINVVLHNVLGGGGMASMRFDPQGKTYGQILLQTPIPIPTHLLEP